MLSSKTRGPTDPLGPAKEGRPHHGVLCAPDRLFWNDGWLGTVD
jgi:hypothetical protein